MKSSAVILLQFAGNRKIQDLNGKLFDPHLPLRFFEYGAILDFVGWNLALHFGELFQLVDHQQHSPFGHVAVRTMKSSFLATNSMGGDPRVATVNPCFMDVKRTPFHRWQEASHPSRYQDQNA